MRAIELEVYQFYYFFDRFDFKFNNLKFIIDCDYKHLFEKTWYAITETCLAFTLFRDDFSPMFVAMFTLLLFLKCFHWLAEDRVDYVTNIFLIKSYKTNWIFQKF